MSPLYEFKCVKCGLRLEIIQAMSQKSPLCPDCKERNYFIPMRRGAGSLAFFRTLGEPNGSTRGTRLYAEELTKKGREGKLRD
ncbi:hypothetical protein LCGC14_1138860 [marine sediment metagenome]|uniref:Putative regulatory protein FmdB zinc ribbon domain-containing protein n=1 Tax=marine sediment metagenome TaxID=412755 RepID=A0A0F9PH35_9ZZZZ